MRKLIILIICLVVLASSVTTRSSVDDPVKPSGRADEGSSDGAMVAKTNVWEDALFSAPELIGTLGELVATSGKAEIKLAEHRGSGDGAIRHSHLGPTVVQLVNEGWKTMMAVEFNVQKIRLLALTIPNDAKKLLQYLSSTPVVAKQFASISVKAMEKSCTKMLPLQKDTKKRFHSWIESLSIMNDLINATAQSYEQRDAQTNTGTEETNSGIAAAERQYKIAQKAHQDAPDAVEKARSALNKALNSLAGHDKTTTIQEVQRYRQALNKAQQNYDRAYESLQQASEKLKNAKVKDTKTKFIKKRLKSIKEVLQKSKELSPKVLKFADNLWRFFTALDKIIIDGLEEDLKAAKSVTNEVIGKDDPKEAMTKDSKMRQRLVQEVTKVVKDSAAVVAVTDVYERVSKHYVLENLPKLTKLQIREGAKSEQNLERFRSHIAEAKNSIKKAITKAKTMFRTISQKWKVEVGKFAQSLQNTD